MRPGLPEPLDLFFVVADSAVLIPDLRVKSALFERLVGAANEKIRPKFRRLQSRDERGQNLGPDDLPGSVRGHNHFLRRFQTGKPDKRATRAFPKRNLDLGTVVTARSGPDRPESRPRLVRA